MNEDNLRLTTRQRRDKYVALRRKGMSQTDARLRTRVPRTTAWRYDKAEGLADGSRDAGPRPPALDDPRPALEGVLSPESLTAMFDGADDSTEIADVWPAEPDPGLSSSLRVADHDDRVEVPSAPAARRAARPDDSGDPQAPTFGYGADPLPQSHPAATRRSFVVGRSRRIDPLAPGPDPDLTAHTRR